MDRSSAVLPMQLNSWTFRPGGGTNTGAIIAQARRLAPTPRKCVGCCCRGPRWLIRLIPALGGHCMASAVDTFGRQGVCDPNGSRAAPAKYTLSLHICCPSKMHPWQRLLNHFATGRAGCNVCSGSRSNLRPREKSYTHTHAAVHASLCPFDVGHRCGSDICPARLRAWIVPCHYPVGTSAATASVWMHHTARPAGPRSLGPPVATGYSFLQPSPELEHAVKDVERLLPGQWRASRVLFSCAACKIMRRLQRHKLLCCVLARKH